MANTKNILIYGDSLTFGKIPGGLRFTKELRYTGVLQNALGTDFLVIEEGLRGRTVSGDNAFFPYRDGFEQFGPILGSHLPLELIVLFLGTNDINSGSSKTVNQIAENFVEYAEKIKWWCEHLGFEVPSVLLVAPPNVNEAQSRKAFGETFVGSQIKSTQFPEEYKIVANKLNWHFFDSATVVHPSDIDGVHLDAENNKQLGNALARVIIEIFSTQNSEA